MQAMIRATLCVILICAPLHGCAPRSVLTAVESPGIRLIIENREFADMLVYLAREGAHLPIGTVEGLRTRTFTVGTAMLTADGSLCLLATTRAGTETLQSPVVLAEPGQEVSWRIERASFGKSITVR
jgi:hypothetical protein